MNILFENNSIIVCIKPVGFSCEEGGKNSIITLLKEEHGLREVFAVHRLDTVTSGVMVFAKTKYAAAFLSKQISENRFHKTYLALVHGEISPLEGIMEDLLFKDSRKNKSFVVKTLRKGVKKAVLDYKVIKTMNNLSLVSINLHTGRTHQIRVQFASRKHPVYGDGKYGASDNIPYICLFSQKLVFTDPETKQEMTFIGQEPIWEFFG